MTTMLQGENGSRQRSIAQLLQQAADWTDAGRPDAALDVLARALDQHGDTAELYTARGWALENTAPARWPEALAAYRAALALDPGQLWARLGQATALERLGDAPAAAAAHADAAMQAAARSATEPEFLELIGWCEYRLGRLDDAVATFRRALAVDPAWTAVQLDLGLVSLLRGDADAAKHYDAALDGLAGRAPQQRTGALRVAIDDLDDAVAAAALTDSAARAGHVRARLASALQAAQ